MATKPEFLVAMDEMLVALVTALITISSPGWLLKYYACVKPAVLLNKGAKLALFSFFWGPSLIVTRDSRNGALWRKHCSMIPSFVVSNLYPDEHSSFEYFWFIYFLYGEARTELVWMANRPPLIFLQRLATAAR